VALESAITQFRVLYLLQGPGGCRVCGRALDRPLCTALNALERAKSAAPAHLRGCGHVGLAEFVETMDGERRTAIPAGRSRARDF
jgi:hypothetical protein